MATVTMELKRKERSVLRRFFTKHANTLENLLGQPEHDFIELESAKKQLQNYEQALKLNDEKILGLIIENPDFSEDELEKEMEEVEKYSSRWLRVLTRYEILIENFKQKSYPEKRDQSMHMRLPKLHIIQFDGNIKNWLPFWNQFKKIHCSPDLENEDKFQYLLEAITPQTEARALVESYPVSNENYLKCMEHLMSRYAREELLIQHYVRELLQLILNNNKEEESLVILYDKLSAHLRALESLGISKNHAAFILPMVESALPQDILKAWERSSAHSSKMEEELTFLLTFLRKEVESEQRFNMARHSFTQPENKTDEFTAECLTVSTKKEILKNCIWCEKNSHSSTECYKMYNMTVEKRIAIIREKKACELCLKVGHFVKHCKVHIKCLICHKRHHTVLCQEPKSVIKGMSTEETTSTASTSTQSQTLLQTVIVEVHCNDKKILTRALLDSGSQRSYIKTGVTEALGAMPVKKEMLSHCLFGGVATNSKFYNVHNFRVKCLEDNFVIDLMALSQNTICKHTPKFNFNDKKLCNLLKQHKITLTDKTDCDEIGLLIGADYLGYLLTGVHIQLGNGLTAIKTKLGWTVQGQVSENSNNIFTNTLLCIRKPTELKSRTELAEEAPMIFEEEAITKSNWADLASRGCKVRELVRSRWWEGPDWLRQPHEKWPHAEHVLAENKMKWKQKRKGG